MKILVTGATGFIGNYLVNTLLDAGEDVRALVLPHETIPAAWGGQVDVVRGDITDRGAVARALDDVEMTYHLAAVVGDAGSKQLFQRVTIDGTRNLLGEARNAGGRVVLVSSIVVYGDKLSSMVCTEDVTHGKPQGFYSWSKQAQEIFAMKAREKGLAVTIVRPGNVYGVGSKLWVSGVINELKRGTPTLISGGHGNAGLCHVRNLVDLLYRVGTTPHAVGRTYNALDASDITWRQYFDDLAAIANTPTPKSVPLWLAQTLATIIEPIWRALPTQSRPPLSQEAINLVGTNHRVPIDRARVELGYAPSIPYADAIREIREWWPSTQR